MAAAPKWKVYRQCQGGSGKPKYEYIASVRYLEDAAVLVGAAGEGSQVRRGHSSRHVLWREGGGPGCDGYAGESWDGAAEIMRARADQSSGRRD